MKLRVVSRYHKYHLNWVFYHDNHFLQLAKSSSLLSELHAVFQRDRLTFALVVSLQCTPIHDHRVLK